MDLAVISLLLISLVSVVQAGEHQAVCPDKKIRAVKDNEAILTCHAKPTMNLTLTLEWRNGSQVAYLSQNGQEQKKAPDLQYRGRTSVKLEGLKTGDLSLKITSVQPSDQGKYRCSIIDPADPSSKTSCYVELVVVPAASSTTAPPVTTTGGGDQDAQIHDTTPSTGTTGIAGSAAAGVVGALVLVAGVAGLILILRKRQMNNKNKKKTDRRGSEVSPEGNENLGGTAPPLMREDCEGEEEEDEDPDRALQQHCPVSDGMEHVPLSSTSGVIRRSHNNPNDTEH